MAIDPGEMRAAADEASDFLKSLANPHRLMILCQLIEQPRSVGDLAHLLGLRPSTVSQHLSLLRKDHLVSTQRAGQLIWYSIASVAARDILQTLYGIYCGRSSGCERPAKNRRRSGNSPRRVVPASTPE